MPSLVCTMQCPDVTCPMERFVQCNVHVPWHALCTMRCPCPAACKTRPQEGVIRKVTSRLPGPTPWSGWPLTCFWDHTTGQLTSHCTNRWTSHCTNRWMTIFESFQMTHIEFKSIHIWPKCQNTTPALGLSYVYKGEVVRTQYVCQDVTMYACSSGLYSVFSVCLLGLSQCTYVRRPKK